MKVAIDAVGIRGHGGAAVLCELLHWLPIARPDWEWHVYLFERQLREFDDPPVSDRVALHHVRDGDTGKDRLRWVNRQLPAQLGGLRPDVLFSFANIAPAKPLVPQVVFCHQLNAFCFEGVPSGMIVKRARLWFMRRQILRGARPSRAVVVQTKAMRERMEEIEPALRGRIHVIPSGYRTPSALPVVRDQVRQAVDSATRPRLLYVSHPSEHKNHLALVEALPLVARGEPGARLLLTLDRVRPNDRRYMGFVCEIEGAAERLGVTDRIVWLGCLGPDEVDFALRRADLMVFPSLAESFGLGLVEAMAAGCPIAAADLPYAHDVAGDAAVYFNPTQPTAIADSVVSALGEPRCLANLTRAGDLLKDQYSYSRIAGLVSQILDAVADGRRETMAAAGGAT